MLHTVNNCIRAYGYTDFDVLLSKLGTEDDVLAFVKGQGYDTYTFSDEKEMMLVRGNTQEHTGCFALGEIIPPVQSIIPLYLKRGDKYISNITIPKDEKDEFCEFYLVNADNSKIDAQETSAILSYTDNKGTYYLHIHHTSTATLAEWTKEIGDEVNIAHDCIYIIENGITYKLRATTNYQYAFISDEGIALDGDNVGLTTTALIVPEFEGMQSEQNRDDYVVYFEYGGGNHRYYAVPQQMQETFIAPSYDCKFLLVEPKPNHDYYDGYKMISLEEAQSGKEFIIINLAAYSEDDIREVYLYNTDGNFMPINNGAPALICHMEDGHIVSNNNYLGYYTVPGQRDNCKLYFVNTILEYGIITPTTTPVKEPTFEGEKVDLT